MANEHVDSSEQCSCIQCYQLTDHCFTQHQTCRYTNDRLASNEPVNGDLQLLVRSECSI